jgi:protein TonB
MSTDQAAAPTQPSPIVGDPQASGAIPAREARDAASRSPDSVAESGEIVHLVAPTYPLIARRKGIEGAVLLHVRFDASGRPEDISVMTSSGSAMLDDAARDAVMRWRFRGGVADHIPPRRRYGG